MSVRGPLRKGDQNFRKRRDQNLRNPQRQPDQRCRLASRTSRTLDSNSAPAVSFASRDEPSSPSRMHRYAEVSRYSRRRRRGSAAGLTGCNGCHPFLNANAARRLPQAPSRHAVFVQERRSRGRMPGVPGRQGHKFRRQCLESARIRPDPLNFGGEFSGCLDVSEGAPEGDRRGLRIEGGRRMPRTGPVHRAARQGRGS